MSRKKRRRNIPNWAQRQRQSDLAWVAENSHILFPAAVEQYIQHGRGVLVVDCTVVPLAGVGHPFAYFPQALVEQLGDVDAIRMVEEYIPTAEIVVVMLKSQGRVSTYRIQTVQPPPSSTVILN